MGFLFLLSFFVSAQEVRTSLYKKDVEAPKVEAKAGQEKRTLEKRRSASSPLGNLPVFYRGGIVRVSGSPVILPSSAQKIPLSGLHFGEMLEAEIPEGVIAFPEGKVPVRARLTKGPFKGGFLLGEATLEKNSKRIAIEFKQLRLEGRDDSFSIVGIAHDLGGLLGIEGRHYSGEEKYFAAEFLAAAASGYADALVERDVTPFGQTQADPTVSNATKKGMASAFSRTADRYADKLKSVPEYVVVRGPVQTLILVTERPTLK